MLEHRLSETVEAKTPEEQLYLAWQDLKQQERFVQDQLKALKPEIEAKLASGEMVGYPDAHLTLQESTRYQVDQQKAKEVFGPDVWARCAEVTGPKMRDALKIGLITQSEFDSVTTPQVSSSLVTKTPQR